MATISRDDLAKGNLGQYAVLTNPTTPGTSNTITQPGTPGYNWGVTNPTIPGATVSRTQPTTPGVSHSTTNPTVSVSKSGTTTRSGNQSDSIQQSSTISSGGSHGESSQQATSFAGIENPEALATLMNYIKQVASGGTEEYKAQMEARRDQIAKTSGIAAKYDPNRAMGDASALVALALRKAMESSLPLITKAIQGAGTSASSMQGLLAGRASQDAAQTSAALGAEQKKAYGGIQAQLASVLERLTVPNTENETNLLKALDLTKISKSQSTATSVQDSWSNSIAQMLGLSTSSGFGNTDQYSDSSSVGGGGKTDSTTAGGGGSDTLSTTAGGGGSSYGGTTGAPGGTVSTSTTSSGGGSFLQPIPQVERQATPQAFPTNYSQPVSYQTWTGESNVNGSSPTVSGNGGAPISITPTSTYSPAYGGGEDINGALVNSQGVPQRRPTSGNAFASAPSKASNFNEAYAALGTNPDPSTIMWDSTGTKLVPYVPTPNTPITSPAPLPAPDNNWLPIDKLTRDPDYDAQIAANRYSERPFYKDGRIAGNETYPDVNGVPIDELKGYGTYVGMSPTEYLIATDPRYAR